MKVRVLPLQPRYFFVTLSYLYNQLGRTGFDSARLVITHADKVGKSLNTYKTISGMTKSDRVAEGEAILASIFGEVAIAA